MRRFWNKYRIYIIIAMAALVYLAQSYYSSLNAPPPNTLNQLEQLLQSEDIKSASLQTVDITQSKLTLHLKDDTEKVFAIPADSVQPYIDTMLKNKVEVSVNKTAISWLTLLTSVLPFLILGSIGLMHWKMGTFSSLGNDFKPEKPNVKFKDVAGIDEVRTELDQLVSALKQPDSLVKLGGKLTRGTLLVGPPGTGKTLLARAVAGEANVPFFAISGSDFDEIYVGVGASRIRQMFKVARQNAPCIIFIDEIDALGKKRTATDSKHANQSLTALLTQMDGFKGETGIIILAATNRVDDLDPALRRPGRFDREIQVPNPDLIGREQILEVTVANRKVRLAEGTDLKAIARGTPGFSGAALANLVNEAVLSAVANQRTEVTMDDFEHAREKQTMGLARAHLISPRERNIVAVHEAGHALLALKHSRWLDPVYKATILPRGRALGMVVILPEADHVTMSIGKLKAYLAMAAGGRAAEKALLAADEITNGAGQDLQQITLTANRMITEWGFGKSPYLAHRLAGDPVNGTLGRLMDVSPEVRNRIDAEVAALVDEVTQEAETFILANKDLLREVADLLLERETVSGDELRKMFVPRLEKPSVSAAA